MIHDKDNKRIYLTEDVSAGELLEVITTIPDLHLYKICKNVPPEYSVDTLGNWTFTEG